MNTCSPILISLGSNLGDRESTLSEARVHLAAVTTIITFSNVVETTPIDMPVDAHNFLNQLAIGSTSYPPEQMMALLLSIETQLGRRRAMEINRNENRVIDLDLLCYADVIWHSPRLILPHPRGFKRSFIIELAHELQKTASELWLPSWDQLIG